MWPRNKPKIKQQDDSHGFELQDLGKTIDHLPEEILVHIMSFLKKDESNIASLVCSRFNSGVIEARKQKFQAFCKKSDLFELVLFALITAAHQCIANQNGFFDAFFKSEEATRADAVIGIAKNLNPDMNQIAILLLAKVVLSKNDSRLGTQFLFPLLNKMRITEKDPQTLIISLEQIIKNQIEKVAKETKTNSNDGPSEETNDQTDKAIQVAERLAIANKNIEIVTKVIHLCLISEDHLQNILGYINQCTTENLLDETSQFMKKISRNLATRSENTVDMTSMRRSWCA